MIIGALAGTALSITLGANLPVVAVLLFGLFGVGWLLIGYYALRPAAEATA